MSKILLLAALAGTLTACTITINGSGSEGNTSANQNTSGGSSGGPVETTFYEEPTTGTPTTGAPSSSSASTGDVPTTDPSTTEPVLTGTTGEPTDGTTDGESSGTTSATGMGTADTTTGGGAGYGMCGWNVEKTYYACTTDNGVPGLEDPKGNYPIDCRDQELAAGAPCGRVGAAGCCTPEGDLYYCADVLVLENCGA
jgi:hypothetical protein